MARYEVKEDEVALITKPIFEEDGYLNGEVSTCIYVSPDLDP